MDAVSSSIVTRWRPWALLVGLAVLLGVIASARAEPVERPIPVDLELVLAVDASGSVDPPEFELQTRGLALAFRDPEVLAALEARARHGVAVSLMLWSGRSQQVVAVDWTLIRDARAAHAFAGRIDAAPRRFQSETAIANALAFALRLLDQNRFQGGRQVIDVSGDGPSNVGGAPDPMRDAAAAASITINGLAILNESPTLDLYYAEHVIGGPDAFLLVAKDFSDFALAIRRKLLREIESAPIAGRAMPGPIRAGRAEDSRAAPIRPLAVAALGRQD